MSDDPEFYEYNLKPLWDRIETLEQEIAELKKFNERTIDFENALGKQIHTQEEVLREFFDKQNYKYYLKKLDGEKEELSQTERSMKDSRDGLTDSKPSEPCHPSDNPNCFLRRPSQNIEAYYEEKEPTDALENTTAYNFRKMIEKELISEFLEDIYLSDGGVYVLPKWKYKKWKEKETTDDLQGIGLTMSQTIEMTRKQLISEFLEDLLEIEKDEEENAFDVDSNDYNNETLDLKYEKWEERLNE